MLIAGALVALVGLSWYLLHPGVGQRTGGSAAGPEFGDRLRTLAERRGAHEDGIRADAPIEKIDGIFVRTWHIGLPNRQAVAELVADLEAEAAAWQGTLEVAQPGPGEVEHVRLELGSEAFDVHLMTVAPVSAPTATPRPSPTATPRPQPPPSARGRLAILLDDAGGSTELLQRVCDLPTAVAVSVLPFLPHTSSWATQLDHSGHEVWLHLPMEAEDPASNPGPGAVMVSMDEAEIRRTVRSALNNVPHVVGVNNHMGSRATADFRTMTWVMQEISARDLCFLDSRTTPDTIAEEAARDQGVRTGRRHVFLDNSRSPAAIRAQLAEAVYRARMQGEAVAIGHVVGVTVSVLESELPTLSERGADLTPPTKLLH